MNNEGLISIIVPCYNSASLLSEALDSLINQTYTNWECIIIDDHSTDNSVEIAEAYRQRFPDKIRVYLNRGKGACSARNNGLRLSEGSYVKFLDSDDAIYDSDVLLKQKEFMEQGAFDIVYGEEWYYWNTFTSENYFKKRGAPIPAGKSKSFYKNFPITSNFLINKKNLDGIRWNEGLSSSQEFFMLFQCFLSGLSFGYQNIPATKIRVHNSVHRISNQSRDKYALQSAELVERMAEEIERLTEPSKDLQFEFKKFALIRRFHAFKAKNREASGRIQKIVKRQKYVPGNALKFKVVSLLNSISSMMGYAGYRFFTLGGRDF